ncbi:nuclear transport factor 2 family protein [Pseudoroseomonas cervicalis]|uniref:nuclear transport factor 2 family protein n=1 Tax=Teichococcus cervicalis TaxID=204525 RepID=UPI0022F1573C|nr:nuclear transport factor 2 family protein [Pseudoroseomonas cervicalis]WBV45481.1 nuclear transport factor 2 family protein [Pseudoroseomonas cervicalis]
MQDDIRALEEARYAAMLAGDLEALAALLSPRLVYAHSDATQDTRESYLESLRSGALRYHAIRHETHHLLPAGDGAVVALGSMRADITRHGAEKSIASLSCAVWAREGGAWRLLAYQPTALPKPAAPLKKEARA